MDPLVFPKIPAEGHRKALLILDHAFFYYL